MIKHVKHAGWEMLTALSMIVDGVVCLLCLGFYRSNLNMHVIKLRLEVWTTEVDSFDESEWDTSDDRVCEFFTGKRK